MNRLIPSTNVLAGTLVLMGIGVHAICAAEELVDNAIEPAHSLVSSIEQYCLDCHDGDSAEAGVDLQRMVESRNFSKSFREWGKVLRMLQKGLMPPEEMSQPSKTERQAMIREIASEFDRYIKAYQGDPGPVLMRRLSSAEYTYTIEDLTNLKLNLSKRFLSDAVGGAGFTNAGGAQFMQDSTLERYLEAAKQIASHAIIGAGPLAFFEDPGLTGRELYAIKRIQSIYRDHGFRTAAGEGAEPFGLERYPQAFLIAWKYRFRSQLELADVSLAELAAAHGQSERFCMHVWSVVNQKDPPFPISLIAKQWKSLPSPSAKSIDQIQLDCEGLYEALREWQSLLAAASGDEEEASVLTAGHVEVFVKHSFEADLDWREGERAPQFELAVTPASKQPSSDALVIWRNPRLQFRRSDRKRTGFFSLKSMVSPSTSSRLKFDQHPAGAEIGENDFVLRGDESVVVTMKLPEGMVSARLHVHAELDLENGADRIVRCKITDGSVQGETAAETGTNSSLLANPDSQIVEQWRSDISRFARLMPEVSHREPAPSDRDPIPAPFDNAYNKPERNHFHYAIKYHRDDAFFVEHIADDTTRRQLDLAWTDLLTAFEYHDAYFRFVMKKFGVPHEEQGIANCKSELMERLPEAARGYVHRLRHEFDSMHKALRAAEIDHLKDALQFAERAWRRPLNADEIDRLQSFYTGLRTGDSGAGTVETGLDHAGALRALLTRILVAPAFLYRMEPTLEPIDRAEVVPLSDWQLAARLSFLLWSSGPGESLRNTVRNGRFSDPEQRKSIIRRMLKDPRSRRLATEFFGQWLGFYRFDEFSGIDTKRFPEFTDQLKSSMYDESILFFDYVIRHGRPLDEILLANYSFMDRTLANHYGVTVDRWQEKSNFTRISHASSSHRGGLLGLGAILTVTSAPLRTSPVKRGDWILRRLLDSPVPPPPADAGSIPADDVLLDGQTVRQRLESHRTETSCMNCHTRIDPLGFALEQFDPIGRWREKYRDGQAIDSSGTLSNSTKINGPAGLRTFLQTRRKQFYRTLCSKLLGYALGRTELLSDRPLIEKMVQTLEDDGRFSDLIDAIVESKQFRYRGAVGIKE